MPSSIKDVTIAIQEYLGHRIDESKYGQRVRKRKLTEISQNQLFDPVDRIHFQNDKEEQINEKKRKRDERREEITRDEIKKKSKRKARQCLYETFQKSRYKGKDWKACPHCNKNICKKHWYFLEDHIQSCISVLELSDTEEEEEL